MYDDPDQEKCVEPAEDGNLSKNRTIQLADRQEMLGVRDKGISESDDMFRVADGGLANAGDKVCDSIRDGSGGLFGIRSVWLGFHGD